MPADALHYGYVADELNTALKDGRIDKITMPEPDEIVMLVRAGGKNRRVVLSANCSVPRVHLTSADFVAPLTAPAFCMHLRRHIGGAQIVEVNCTPFERVITFVLSSKNELGYPEKKRLIAEIMGKYSNIILVNENGKISDSIKRISPDTSQKRQVLPGLGYCAPPQQNKIDLSDAEQLTRRLEAFEGGRIDTFILSAVSGLAPATIKEAVWQALGTFSATEISPQNADKIVGSLLSFYDKAANKPCVILEEGKRRDFACRPLITVGGEYEFYPTLNEAMDAYYSSLDKTKRLDDKAHNLLRAVRGAFTRTQKKLAEFYRRRDEANDLDGDKLSGELILANLYRIQRGDSVLVADNYYADPPQKISVALDPTVTPQQNAQQYYKKYMKKKKTLTALSEQIERAEADADYYESILSGIETADNAAVISEIYAEAENAGILHAKKKTKKPVRTSPAPLTVFSCGEFTVTVGRNNLQNDKITKEARGSDIWLHTQKIHGSHVIISAQGKPVPDDVILFAAKKAALYSKAANSQSVPVDYCPAKNVSKPKGAPLGKVVYTGQKTVYVDPE